MNTIAAFFILGLIHTGTRAGECPDNAHVAGASPPDGYSRGCMITKDNGEEVRHGPWQEWYMNGGKSAEGSYLNGKQHGDWTWWYPNGQKRTQGRFWDASPVGKWLYWNENGRTVDKNGNESAEQPQKKDQNLPDFSDFSKSMNKKLK